MSERQLLPGSPFGDFDDEQLPDEQLAAKRLIQDITNAAVMPFEQEKLLVNRDHVAMQKTIWGEREDEKHPVELPNGGA